MTHSLSFVADIIVIIRGDSNHLEEEPISSEERRATLAGKEEGASDVSKEPKWEGERGI